MDVFETIFSFVPLLMVILFFTRIAKSAGRNKKRKESDNAAAEAKVADESAADTKHIGVKPGTTLRSKLLDGSEDFAGMMAKLSGKHSSPEEDGAPAGKTEATALAPTAEAPTPIEQASVAPVAEGLHALNSQHAPGDSCANPRVQQNGEQLSKLNNLKKAVVWAEILGKPRGLE
ncbi:MAG: hypothetical protein PQJ61_03060 [Spirochaetales bacterium]|uniref:Uncharacterized protein n=1 Tax=Candidatus Thalassospirochaeta sargassi TaxID=3119039 RepID=A0AAJ1IAK7_9SPIO|nr:hypothetical protein [Spirochaetales bacterium]